MQSIDESESSHSYHDTIFFNFSIIRFDKYERTEEVIKLYQQGLSLREVGVKVDLSKTKVRDLLIHAKIPLRSMRNEKGQLMLGARGKRNTKPPYGFWFLNGEVQQHPKEYPIVLEIVERHKAGQPMNSIASWLNRKNIKSPMNKKWSWNSVKNVIVRLESRLVQSETT